MFKTYLNCIIHFSFNEQHDVAKNTYTRKKLTLYSIIERLTHEKRTKSEPNFNNSVFAEEFW